MFNLCQRHGIEPFRKWWWVPKQTISNSTGELSSKSKRKCLQVGVVVHIVWMSLSFDQFGHKLDLRCEPFRFGRILLCQQTTRNQPLSAIHARSFIFSKIVSEIITYYGSFSWFLNLSFSMFGFHQFLLSSFGLEDFLSPSEVWWFFNFSMCLTLFLHELMMKGSSESGSTYKKAYQFKEEKRPAIYFPVVMIWHSRIFLFYHSSLLDRSW